MRFRKRPIEIEADQWKPGKRIKGVILASDKDAPINFDDEHGHRLPFGGGKRYCPVGLIKTLEGTMVVRSGDWVITGIKGEIYPCKPDIFEATYEPV